jgi:hypothetical protein
MYGKNVGWRQIGNPSCHYRFRRDGHRVVSEHLGLGHPAVVLSLVTKFPGEERAAERAERRRIGPARSVL